MSERVWTPEQQRVIASEDKNLLVSAGAGSGKTAVLTERLKRLVLEKGEDCSKMLVLTFTRAAAAEMRERFKDELYDALREGDWNLSEREILAQIDALTDAQISTIDAFAAMMSRRYFEVAEVDPGFRVADQAELELLLQEAIDEVFEERFLASEAGEESDGFTDLIDLYGGSRSHEALRERVRELINFMETLPDPYAWLEETVQAVETADEESFYALPVFDALKTRFQSALSSARDNYRKIAFLNEKVPWKKGNKSKEKFDLEIKTGQNLKPEGTFPELFSSLKEYTPGVGVRFPKNSTLEQEELKSLREETRDELTDLLKTYGAYDLETEYIRAQEMNRHFKNLIALARAVEERVQAKKDRSRLMSFTDLERALLKILRDPKSREEIQKTYSYIFLDEFQDSTIRF